MAKHWTRLSTDYVKVLEAFKMHLDLFLRDLL